MSPEPSAVLAFLNAVLWPLVTVLAILLFRRPVIRLASELAIRTKKVTFKGVSVELETLPVLSPSWSVSLGDGVGDVRQLTSSQLFDSYSHSLFEQLLKPTRADYAIMDLGSGKKWLASRLYIFSLILGEVSRLKALVFLETTPGIRRRFLGVANPAEVRASLGRNYPWLEQAFALAYAAQFPQLDPDAAKQTRLCSTVNVLDAGDTHRVMQLVRGFVDNLQRKTDPPETEESSHLSFQQVTPVAIKIWERTRWLDGESLERMLDQHLISAKYPDSPDLSQRTRIEGILRRKSRYVALVDEDGRFTGLVDRYDILNRYVKHPNGIDDRSTT